MKRLKIETWWKSEKKTQVRGHWEILRLREWHGYGPALLAGLGLVTTDLVLVVQHDYAFVRAAPVAVIAAAMLAAWTGPPATAHA